MLLTTVKDEFVFHCQSRNLSPLPDAVKSYAQIRLQALAE